MGFLETPGDSLRVLETSFGLTHVDYWELQMIPGGSLGLLGTCEDSLELFGTSGESLALQGSLGDSLDFLETPWDKERGSAVRGTPEKDNWKY